MLVCNVSLRPLGRTIAANLAEIATAEDASTIGNIVFAALVDDPANVDEIVDAYLGEIMLEAASATDVTDAAIPAIYTVAVNEVITAADAPDAASGVSTTWSPTDKTSFATLSNGNLTAVCGGNQGVRSTTSVAIGNKVYCEFTQAANTNATMFTGIITGSVTLGDGSSTMMVGIVPGSGGTTIYYNNSATGISMPVMGINTVFCMAYDRVHETLWFRVNGGDWNGNASYNPATNVGGIDVSWLGTGGGGGAPVSIYTGIKSASSGSNLTANFGASAFAFTMPSGFVTWNTAAT